MHDSSLTPLTLNARSVSRTIDDQALLAPTTLTVLPGECWAVLGQNGAGKTTLLRMLAGKLRPTHGEVTLGEHTADERNPVVRREVASLIGVPAYYPDLVLGEQLAVINATWGVPMASSEQATASALDRFGITGLRHRFPHELSSGQAQLFHLACTFSRPFTTLLLDEPEQRLDPQRKDLLVAAMREANRHGATIVFSSHDAAMAQRLTDNTVTLA